MLSKYFLGLLSNYNHNEILPSAKHGLQAEKSLLYFLTLIFLLFSWLLLVLFDFLFV